MSITVALLCKNERHRWLPACLAAWQDFADHIVAVDDGSTDGTAEWLFHENVIVASKPFDAWGNEAKARMKLWHLAVEQGDDWLFFLDADMMPAADPSWLFGDYGTKLGIAFRLYDLWGTEGDALVFRDDDYWSAHLRPRVWAVPNPGPAFEPEWNQRGIHCGHLPANLQLDDVIVAPQEYSLLHLGYMRKEDRKKKWDAYMAVRDQLTDYELEHALTICDVDPHVKPLPFFVDWPIQYGS